MESPFFKAESPQPRASFQGRLQLQEFMFKPAPASPSQSPVKFKGEASPSLSPLRRSPRKSTPLGPVASLPSRVSKARSKSTTAAGRKVNASASASPAAATSPKTKTKRRRQASGYAPPSTYAHLPPLEDILAPDLLILFVGLNPGLQTARSGHVYAHPSNLFWKLLFSSGITPRLCAPAEDRELPRLYGLGNTNIVSRPSRNGAELSKAEMDEGVGALEDKIRGCRPETVCIVGKSIWESVWRVRHGRGIKKDEFRYGWQDGAENMGVVSGDCGWAGARVFVASSTSGLAATLRPAEKERIWRELGEWCEWRRAEKSVMEDPS